MLERLGAQVSYDARPNFDLDGAMRNYQTLLNSVMTAAWDDQAVAQMQTKVAALQPDDMSLDAVNARAAVLSHRDWIRSNSRREKLRHAWAEFLQ
jgi:amidase